MNQAVDENATKISLLPKPVFFPGEMAHYSPF